MTDPHTPAEIAEALEIPAALADHWLVWSNEHGAWWRANSAGYCTELLGAGIYTREEAERIERDANAHGDRNETAVPLAKKWGAYLGMLTPGTVLHAIDRAAAAKLRAMEGALDIAAMEIGRCDATVCVNRLDENCHCTQRRREWVRQGTVKVRAAMGNVDD